MLGAARRGAAEQADRAPAGDQREDGQVAPDADLPRARRHRPHAGGAVGRAPRPRRALRALTATKVPLRRGRRRARCVLRDVAARSCSRSPPSPGARCSSPPAAARARSGGDGERRGPRQRRAAAAAPASELRLRARDGAIQLRVRGRAPAPRRALAGRRWCRSAASRGAAPRARGTGGLARSAGALDDLGGAGRVTVRRLGPARPDSARRRRRWRADGAAAPGRGRTDERRIKGGCSTTELRGPQSLGRYGSVTNGARKLRADGVSSR